MKKQLLAFSISLCIAMTIVGCGNKKTDDKVETKTETTAVSIESQYGDSVEVLSAIWDGVNDKFPCYGGSIEESVDSAPGKLKLTDTNTMTNTLLIPTEVQGKITDAGTLVHMMNANTFTGAAIKVDDMSTEEVASKLKDSFLSNQFMCGMPDKIVIISVDDYVVYAYGAADIVDDFMVNAKKLENVKEIVDQKFE